MGDKRGLKKGNQFDKTMVPENFTLSLCLVDAIPVLFFGGSMVLISRLFDSRLFLVGALLCLFAGACKVLWKLIVVLAEKNIWFLFIQMRIGMPIGFLLMLLSLLVNHKRVSLAGILGGLTSFPSCILFLLGVTGMSMMGVFAKKLDSGDVRANWVEQLTNGIAQGCIFAGLLLLVK